MIRINLYGGLQVQTPGLDMIRRALVITACTLSGALVVGLTVLLVRTLASAPEKPTPVSAPAPEAPPVVTRVPYRSLPLSQRLAYEISFGGRIADALTAALPAGVTPSRVVIDSFEVLRVEGRSGSKEQVASLLAGLRSDDLKLAPKPETQVTVRGDGSYEYTAVARACFLPGQGNQAPDSVLAGLPSPEQYAAEVKRFEQLAAGANVAVRKGLRFVAAQKAGAFRRYVYRMEASATMDDFVRLVRAVRDNRVSCAFAAVQLTAGRSGRMDAAADLYFTARE